MPRQDQYTSLTDEQLLDRYRAGMDNRWLGYLLQRYTLLLLGVAMKYLKDKDAAEDAVQQVFLKALTHIPREEMRNFKGWLYILMRNYCLQQLRKRTFRTSEDVLQQLSAAPDATKELVWKDYTLEQLNEAIRELAPEQRQAITMFYLQKLSYQQITERTGHSFMQVKSYIQNGKRNLKMILIGKLGNRQP